MGKLIIRIKPEKKILIEHKGEILTLVVSVNKAYSELVTTFNGPTSFIIDREGIFHEKKLNYKLGEEANGNVL